MIDLRYLEYEICRYCNKDFLKYKNKRKSAGRKIVARRFGAVTCSRECARDYARGKKKVDLKGFK